MRNSFLQAPLQIGVALCEGIIANRQLPVARKLAAVRRTEENTAYVPPNKFFAVLHTAGGKVSYVTSNKYFTLGVRIAIGITVEPGYTSIFCITLVYVANNKPLNIRVV